jgi:hypothetical protein
MPIACEFSEFTYGYVFTDEQMRAGKIHTAPVFPTLHQEHKHGGYDVEIAGLAFVQFKRPYIYEGNRCREVVNGQLKAPVFRMNINQAQHETLRKFEKTESIHMRVFYACPCFHDVNELNVHYNAGMIMAQSAIFRPKSLGKLNPGPHHVSFTTSSLKKGFGYCYSEEGDEVASETSGQVAAWVAETLVRPEISREQLVSFVFSLRQRTDPAQRLPGVVLSEGSTVRDALTALSRLSQVLLDSQPLVVGRRKAAGD